MEPLVLLLIPALAALWCVLPAGRRSSFAATLLAMAAVLALALHVAAAAAGPAAVAGNGWLEIHPLGALVVVLVAFVGVSAVLFSRDYLASHPGPHGGAAPYGYYALCNLFVLSMLAVPLLASLALVWIAVALTTLLSAFLVGYADTPPALEAAWKYVVLTTLGAVLALLGMLILFWGIRAAGGDSYTWQGLAQAAPHMPPALLRAGFLLVLVGFGTKAGLVPMHTWLPDAHSQAPAPVCALLSGVETTTVLYVILRLLPPLQAAGLVQARYWLVAFGLLSVAVAALLLVHVRDYKRLFAFSTVEHMGIVLVAVGVGGAEARFGAALQILAHAVVKSFCFLAAGMVVLAAGTQEIAAVRGLLRASPATGLALLVGGLAIAGAPPFAVFVGEFAILRAGLAGGHWVVAGLLGFFIAVAFCAVMWHVSRMVFGAADAQPAGPAAPWPCTASLLLAAAPLLLLGVYVPHGARALLHAAARTLGG